MVVQVPGGTPQRHASSCHCHAESKPINPTRTGLVLPSAETRNTFARTRVTCPARRTLTIDVSMVGGNFRDECPSQVCSLVCVICRPACQSVESGCVPHASNPVSNV